MLKRIYNNLISQKTVFFIISVCCIMLLSQVKWSSLSNITNVIIQKAYGPSTSVDPSEKLSKLMTSFTVKEVSCSKLFQNDTREQEKALRMTKYRGPTLPMRKFANISCESFVQERQYITIPLTKEEENFPIAFTIMAYKDIGQVERLLRAIYRPQNAYCIHADKKSPKEFYEGLKRLASCFPNVIMSSRSVDVKWGRWTNLECDLICMEDLVKRFPKWKYLINLTGQEFPLRTNLELVRILKTLNGSNNIIAVPIYPSRVPKKKPSFPLQWLQGAVHITAVRRFIEFLFKDKRAIEIRNLIRNSAHPDETLFATVNHNTHLKAPGGYLGYFKNKKQDMFLTRLKHWAAFAKTDPCKSGRYVRSLCIFGVKDLAYLSRQPQLIMNKLYWDFQPFTYDCLEERHFNNTWRDYLGLKPPLDLQFYRKFDSVKNHQ